MKDEAISALEKAIRLKAANEAKAQFKTLQDQLLWRGLWSRVGWENSDSSQLAELLKKFMNNVVVPLAEEDAIKAFLGTYQNLLYQFPELQETTDDVRADQG